MARAEETARRMLARRVEDNYAEVRSNVFYDNGRGNCGEIDFMGRRWDGRWDVYEIKTRPKRSLVDKAHAQLARASRNFNVGKTYIYYSMSGDLVEVCE